ncbi:MAG: response regulator transcription factor [Acidimicrobiales bacterium]|nr:response regulator transcription factor [Acidimicrobiales bacterium]
MNVRVLVVDDQALVRAGFRMILEAEDDLTVVGEAADGREALALTRRARPDVVLMDVRMPVMDGIEATRQLGRLPEGERPKVLVLTTFEVDDDVFAALRAGASGFLLKDTPPDDLIEAIRVVAAGDSLLSPSITRRLIEEFARQPLPSTSPPPALDLLTDRELEVLRHLARGLSNAEIAEALVLGETTVKTHVGRVLAKLGLRDRVQAVVLAYECGLVRPGRS